MNNVAEYASTPMGESPSTSSSSEPINNQDVGRVLIRPFDRSTMNEKSLKELVRDNDLGDIRYFVPMIVGLMTLLWVERVSLLK